MFERPVTGTLGDSSTAPRRIGGTYTPFPIPDPHAKLPRTEVPMDSALVNRDPDVMSGMPCFTGTRVPVKTLFDYLEGNSTLEDSLADFPSVTRERAVAVLEAARERLSADAPAA